MDYIYIKDVKIPKTAALAPMAGVADKAYRLIAKSFGAAYMVAEMASCKGLVYNDTKTAELLTVTADERPMAIQLFGAEPAFVGKAIAIASQYKPDIIDINCGCPVNKVVSNGAGSALMKSPKLLAEMITAAVEATDIPITVKIRSGWDSSHVNAVECAKIAEGCGASAITVHGRTREQMYTENADLEIIRQVKQAVSIPVIGNGDVNSLESCINMYKNTGCDLVMIGRASFGNPWLFKQIDDYYKSGAFPVFPTLDEKIEVLKEHINLLVLNKGERVGMKEARKHAAWYFKGLPNAAMYRNLCGKLSTINDFYELCESILRKDN